MSKISVVTYNVWFDYRDQDKRTAEIILLLRSIGSTVVCLQEVTPKTYPMIESELKKDGYQSCFNNVEQFQKIAKIGYGVVIFSKQPILSVSVCPFINTRMGRYFIIVKLKNLSIITTHLESLPQSAKTRQKQIQQILESVTLLPSVIWTMDSNLTDTSNDGFPNCGLKDCWIEAGSPEESRFTYVSPKYQSRLDRVYHNTNLSVTNFQLIGNYDVPPSDHYGVSVEFNEII